MPRTAPPLAEDPLVALLLDELETSEQQDHFDAWNQDIPASMWNPPCHSPGANVHTTPRAEPIELDVRHAEHLVERRQLRDALVAAGTNPNAIERYDNCGADAWLEVRDDGQQCRTRAYFCRNRFCPACANANKRKIARRILQLLERGAYAFTTLTLVRSDATIDVILDRLYACFRNLRRRAWWMKNVSGGLAVAEMTRGKNGDHWHVHMHVVHPGKPLNQWELSDEWYAVTGDSYIVHSTVDADATERADYLAKYASKGIPWRVYANPDLLRDAVVALRGRRLLVPFGDWYGEDDQDEPEDTATWRNVGRVADIATDAACGIPWCIGLMLMQHREVHHDNGELVVTVVDPPASDARVIGCTPSG